MIKQEQREQDRDAKDVLLGDHDGLPVLADRERARGVLLRALGRLKAGRDVSERRKAIARALAQVEDSDRHWMEGLASRLASEGGIEAVPSHLAALAVAWDLVESELAAMIRSVNSQRKDPFVGQAVAGMSAAAPEFSERLAKGNIDSDQVFLRVALAHVFRRDPSSTFSMFVIDGMAKNLHKVLRMSLNDFVKSCLERFDEEPAPLDAWGYVIVLRGLTGKAGYFIREPGPDEMEELHRLRGKLEGLMGPLSDAAFFNHIAAGAFSGHLMKGNPGGFAALMSGLMAAMNDRFVVLYAREEEGPDGGVHTDILSIPASNAEEARRIGIALPPLRMHDSFRSLKEFMAQQADLEAREKS